MRVGGPSTLARIPEKMSETPAVAQPDPMPAAEKVNGEITLVAHVPVIQRVPTDRGCLASDGAHSIWKWIA